MTMRSVLAIAGLDPGGGAGVAADLRAFSAAGVFGCAAVAVNTIQSTAGLVASLPVEARLLRRQLDELASHQRIDVVKIGALGSAPNIHVVATWLRRHPRLPAVVDPVLLPSAGKARLLASGGLRALREELIPRAALVTANRPEAEAISGRSVRNVEDAGRAALAIVASGARAALVKGGHFRGREAVDVLAVGGRVLPLSAPRLALPPLHGGGCVLAALIAGRLAVDADGSLDERIVRAVRWARRAHRRALRASWDVGGPRRVLVPRLR